MPEDAPPGWVKITAFGRPVQVHPTRRWLIGGHHFVVDLDRKLAVCQWCDGTDSNERCTGGGL